MRVNPQSVNKTQGSTSILNVTKSFIKIRQNTLLLRMTVKFCQLTSWRILFFCDLSTLLIAEYSIVFFFLPLYTVQEHSEQKRETISTKNQQMQRIPLDSSSKQLPNTFHGQWLHRYGTDSLSTLPVLLGFQITKSSDHKYSSAEKENESESGERNDLEFLTIYDLWQR